MVSAKDVKNEDVTPEGKAAAVEFFQWLKYPTDDSFSNALFTLISKANVWQLNKIHGVWPEHVEIVLSYQQSIGSTEDFFDRYSILQH